MAEKKTTKTTKPTIPSTAKQPQDRQTAEADLVSEDLHVQWNGHTYVIKARARKGTRFLRYVTKAEELKAPAYFILALEELLGAEGMREFEDRNAVDGSTDIDEAFKFINHVSEVDNQGN